MKTKKTKSNKRGCVLRSAQQRQELIEAYQSSSGLGKAEFCRRHGLVLATFCHWLNARWGNPLWASPTSLSR